MNFNSNIPYNNLPLLPPKKDIETRAILRKTISTSRALAELKLAGELIPNQAVLINTIPLLEARLSSEIENIVTTTDELFQYSGNENEARNPTVKETLRYRGALYEGFLHLKDKAAMCRNCHNSLPEDPKRRDWRAQHTRNKDSEQGNRRRNLLST